MGVQVGIHLAVAPQVIRLSDFELEIIQLNKFYKCSGDLNTGLVCIQMFQNSLFVKWYIIQAMS